MHVTPYGKSLVRGMTCGRPDARRHPTLRRKGRRIRVAALLAAAAILSGCQVNEPKRLAAATTDGSVPPLVPALRETQPVASSEDAADDAVIVVADDRSWIVGADKKFGLRVYDLAGRQQAELAVGFLNNVDAVELDDGSFLLAGSNRTTRAIDLFIAEPRGALLDVRVAAQVPLGLDQPYGLCMAALDDGISVFVGDQSGRVERWRIDGDLRGRRSAVYEFDSQTEGCVVDVTDGTLYVGEEATGIWAVRMRDGLRRLLDRVDAGRLTADVEGLDIYYGDERLLVASSQGDDSFVIYRLPGGQPLAKFRIGPNADLSVDGAIETDGVAVTARALPDHPDGLLVVQDGRNRRPPENQNFKLVDWREIRELLRESP